VLNSSRDDSVCLCLRREKRHDVSLSNTDSHFIDQARQSLDIGKLRNCSSTPKPHHENRSPAQLHRHACLHDAALFLGGNRRLLLLTTS